MKTFAIIIFSLFYFLCLITAQDTLYFYKAGMVINKRAVADMDSVIFAYKVPASLTVTDLDGNVYHTINIGTQTWMVENLKSTKFRTGESISNILDNTWGTVSYSAWSDYNNNSSNGDKYGRLYNWYAVVDNRNIAPNGWHIPSSAEWNTLSEYLIRNGYNFDGTTTDNKIAKSLSSKDNWLSSSIIGTIGNNPALNNSSGFNALPGGSRYSDGNSYSIGLSGYWWSSTSYNIRNAYFMSIFYDALFMNLDNFEGYKQNGFSVRCLKD